MPELPEVETVVRSLKRLVKGKVITSAEIIYPKLIKSDILPSELETQLKGRKIDDITRMAKHIIFHFQDMVLISHLRMEGKWFYESSDSIYDKKHVEAIFKFGDNTELAYNDTRKFGTFHWQKADEYKNINPIAKLGLEPFDKRVDGLYLQNVMGKSRKHIKTLLLDQTLLSGIGNIYADEICFDAGIRPEKVGSFVSLQEFERIANSARKILAKSIDMGGTTIDTYQPEKGVDGKFQNELKVHTRKGEKCYTCGTEIVKTKVNGRGTYYCSTCQNW